MKTKQIFYLSMVFVLIISGISCEGPAGPDGSRGEQGIQGEPGPQGEPGNADIMYSGWMDIDWFEGSDDLNKEMAIHEPRVTSGFLNDGGIVLMFMKTEGNENVLVYPLPWTSAGIFYFGFILADAPDALQGDGLQGIIFLLRSADGETPIPDSLWEGLQIRYVLVPGSVNLAGKGLDWTNYDHIVDIFNITR